MTKARFRRWFHDDRTKYVVYVLWLIGNSQTVIARSMGLRKAQVAGIITNSEYKNRSAMSQERRQELLDELRAIRLDEAGNKLDGGALDRVGFKARAALRRTGG